MIEGYGVVIKSNYIGNKLTINWAKLGDISYYGLANRWLKSPGGDRIADSALISILRREWRKHKVHT